jgi:hypothetical protein
MEISSYNSATPKAVPVCQSWLLKLAVACSTFQAPTKRYILYAMQSVSTSRKTMHIKEILPGTWRVGQHHAHNRESKTTLSFSDATTCSFAPSPVPALHLDDIWVGYLMCAESNTAYCTSSRRCWLSSPLPSMVVQHNSSNQPVIACRKRFFMLYMQKHRA